MAVVYKITNMENGKYYIGSAKSFALRKWQHRNDLRKGVHKNPHLQASWNKYGPDAFVFEILEEVPEGVHAYTVENTYLAVCVGKPDCYNVNTDAFTPRLGIKHTARTRAKISAAVQAAVAAGRAGKFKRTPELLAKLSASLKGNKNALGYKRTAAEKEASRARALGNQNWLGRNHSEESKEKMSRKIRAILPDRSEKLFKSLTEIRDTMDVSIATIIRACTSGKPIKCGACAGYILSYADAPVANKAPEIPEEYKDLPRTRQDAKEQGAKHYFTGIACEKGHIAPRKTKGVCIECARIDDKKAQEKKRAAKAAAQ